MKNIQNIKTFAVHTLGCSKNVVDSENLIGKIEANGFSYTEDLKETDALIINTCGFIKSAKDENVNYILQAAELRKKGKIKKLIVMGCLAERYKSELESQIHEVDNFFGLNATDEILNSLGEPNLKYELAGERHLLTPKHYAYLKLAEGCNRTCSFCAIPLIRGKHLSLPKEELVNSAKKIANAGIKELVLISQDSSYYGKDLYGKNELANLMNDLADIELLRRIRLMYVYPSQFPMEVLDVIRDRPNICNYIDMPLQHISDKLLKSMRRGITKAQTYKLIENIRKAIPNVTFRSTFIVGYPEETEQDFLELLDFIKEVELDRVGVFTYSQEEGTRAFELGDPIPEEVKEQRRGEIMLAQQDISLRKNLKQLNKELEVIVDEFSEGYYYTRTEGDAPEIDNAVLVKSNLKLQQGDFIKVKITKAEAYDLYGKQVLNNQPTD